MLAYASLFAGSAQPAPRHTTETPQGRVAEAVSVVSNLKTSTASADVGSPVLTMTLCTEGVCTLG